jgi:hypothetical protein
VSARSEVTTFASTVVAPLRPVPCGATRVGVSVYIGGGAGKPTALGSSKGNGSVSPMIEPPSSPTPEYGPES